MNDTMVVVDIRDTGVGISEENIKKIYDPFFTTKSTGKGTGLGLAVTYGIIQEHGGRIFVDSSPDRGLTSGSSCRPGTPHSNDQQRTSACSR